MPTKTTVTVRQVDDDLSLHTDTFEFRLEQALDHRDFVRAFDEALRTRPSRIQVVA